MCGIAGIAPADPKKTVDLRMLKAMTDIVAHRGPDGEGFHAGAGIGLGFRRLSIIDIETGDQPMQSEDGAIIVVCNGEIYNYLELRTELIARGHSFRSQSDVEVIVHLYEEQGVGFLQRLRGMFAIALWDNKDRKLLLARDRYGIKPLDYAVDQDGTLYFGSELKSILMVARIDRSIHPEAVEDLLTFGYVLSPKTLFKNIHKIMPGHFFIFQHGKIRHERYYDYHLTGEDSSHQAVPASEWADAVADKLKESVALHLRSDVPVCSWLSAGIDSSSVAAITRTLIDKPLQTYSLTFEDPTCDEVTRQRTLDAFPGYDILNERVLCAHHHFELFRKSVWHAEEPTPSGVHMVQMVLAKKTSEDFKVALAGEGADEALAGYLWHLNDRLFSAMTWIQHPLKKLLMLCSSIQKLKPLLADIILGPRDNDMLKYARLSGAYGGNFVKTFLSDDLRTEYSPCHPALAEVDRSHWARIEKALYIDTRVRMPDFVLNGLDRMSMSSSVEVRVPFLDHEFVELCAKIPASLKLKCRQEKYILRKAMQAYLPREILERKKRGMNAPSGSWLRGQLPPFIEEMLDLKKIRENGYFNAATVIDSLKRHRESHGNFARPLMTVLCVQAWDDLFVKGCRPDKN